MGVMRSLLLEGGSSVLVFFFFLFLLGFFGLTRMHILSTHSYVTVALQVFLLVLFLTTFHMILHQFPLTIHPSPIFTRPILWAIISPYHLYISHCHDFP